jgi:hypothetical protein
VGRAEPAALRAPRGAAGARREQLASGVVCVLARLQDVRRVHREGRGRAAAPLDVGDLRRRHARAAAPPQRPFAHATAGRASAGVTTTSAGARVAVAAKPSDIRRAHAGRRAQAPRDGAREAQAEPAATASAAARSAARSAPLAAAKPAAAKPAAETRPSQRASCDHADCPPRLARNVSG